MQNKIVKRLYLGFIQVHVLYHAMKEALFGTWMIEELAEHGYSMNPGTLYPMLPEMAEQGLLFVRSENVNGRIRKYYSITNVGESVLLDAKKRALELVHELGEASTRTVLKMHNTHKLIEAET